MGAHPRQLIRLGNRAFCNAVDRCGTATAFWYLSGLVCALGITFGFLFLAPGPEARAARRDTIASLRAFDAEWYARIAEEGYSYDPASRSSLAFFPLYPLLGRLVARVLPVRTETALLIVSNASFLAALVVLASYVRVRYAAAPRILGEYAVLAAALFPTAFFFRLPYSESTFLVLIALVMLGIERRWPTLLVATVAGLATATRPVGVALLAPLALDVWRRQPSLARRFTALTVWLSLACWGLVVYMAYQYAAFGDALAFAKTQRHWGVRAAPDLTGRLWACLTFDPVVAVYKHDSAAYWARGDPASMAWLSLQFANPIFMIVATGLLLLGANCRDHGSDPAIDAAGTWRISQRWLNRYELSLAALLLLIPYLTRGYEMGMGSMGRFVAVVFPIYLVLARLFCRLPPAIAAAASAASGFLIAAYSAMFVAGYAIF